MESSLAGGFLMMKVLSLCIGSTSDLAPQALHLSEIASRLTLGGSELGESEASGDAAPATAATSPDKQEVERARRARFRSSKQAAVRSGAHLTTVSGLPHA